MRTQRGHTNFWGFFRFNFRYSCGGGGRGFCWPPGSRHFGAAHFVGTRGRENTVLFLLLMIKIFHNNIFKFL